jgi:hypothetical protein
MTVKELIEQLQLLNPDLQVFTSGYEGGFNDVEISKPDTFCLNVNSEWYYGSHEISSHVHEEDRPNYKQVRGIVL